jgi:hypothetical protein
MLPLHYCPPRLCPTTGFRVVQGTIMAKKAKKAKAKAKSKKARKTKKKKAKKSKKKARRTVLYSSKGKKLYAVRDKGGKFKDIQTYKRAHGQDIKRNSKEEMAAAPAPASSDEPKPM